MINVTAFAYRPEESECEKASNAYVMSLVAIIAGMPLPIINLVATLIFFLGNLRGTYFTRWHCTQALLSQLSLVCINSVGFWWTVSVFFRGTEATNMYVAYIMTAFMFNLTEFIATIYTATQTRKGIHVEWWFYGDLTNVLCKPDQVR